MSTGRSLSSDNSRTDDRYIQSEEEPPPVNPPIQQVVPDSGDPEEDDSQESDLYFMWYVNAATFNILWFLLPFLRFWRQLKSERMDHIFVLGLDATGQNHELKSCFSPWFGTKVALNAGLKPTTPELKGPVLYWLWHRIHQLDFPQRVLRRIRRWQQNFRQNFFCN